MCYGFRSLRNRPEGGVPRIQQHVVRRGESRVECGEGSPYSGIIQLRVFRSRSLKRGTKQVWNCSVFRCQKCWDRHLPDDREILGHGVAASKTVAMPPAPALSQLRGTARRSNAAR